MVAVTIVLIGTGLLLVALSIPLIRRRVKPNAVYGLRIPATFADEWVWYEANARSGWDLLVVGLVTIAVALFTRLAGLADGPYALLNAGILLSGVLFSCVVGWRRANRLLRERRGTAAPG